LREITGEDSDRANFFDQIRYVRTMRDLAKEIGLSDEIDEFDNYLLEIADETDDIQTREILKGALTEDKDEILNIRDTYDFGGQQNDPHALAFYTYRKNLIEQNLLSEKSQLNEVIVAAQLQQDSDVEVKYLEEEIKRLNEEINKLSADDLNLSLEIKDLRLRKDSLKDDEDFEKEDLDGKIKKFNDLYDKKKTQDGK